VEAGFKDVWCCAMKSFNYRVSTFQEKTMKKIDITIIALRLIGVYCLIESVIVLERFTFILGGSTKGDDPFIISTVLSIFIPAVVLIFIGLLLLLKTGWLAERLTPKPSNEQISVQWKSEEIQSILFSVFGIFIFSAAIPRVFWAIGQLITAGQVLYPTTSLVPRIIRDTWLALTGGVIQLVVGAALFFQARTLSAWWHRLREWTPNREK
jgi:hypothetical protein